MGPTSKSVLSSVVSILQEIYYEIQDFPCGDELFLHNDVVTTHATPDVIYVILYDLPHEIAQFMVIQCDDADLRDFILGAPTLALFLQDE